MKLVCLYLDERLASSRIRILEMLPFWQELGADVRALPFPRSGRERRELRAALEQADVCLLQKKLPSFVDGRWLGRLRCPIVFDFDDAILFRQRPKRGSYRSATRARRFARALERSKAFVAGNAYLASLCKSAGKPTLVAPSPVPIDVPRRTHSEDDRLVIGWIGGRGNLDALRSIEGALRQLSKRHDLVLRVICDEGLALDGVRVEHRPWGLDSAAADLATFDIGVMPVEEATPWSLGKCSYKLLQYMAAEVPVVASPVGMNAELVRDGENGLLVSGEEQWTLRLGQLIGDVGQRRALGAAGRSSVETEYSYPVLARRTLDFLRSF